MKSLHGTEKKTWTLFHPVDDDKFMNRRKFLATTSGAISLAQAGMAKPGKFNGLIRKAVKFGTKPDEKQMQKLKDLGFDGIEG